MSAQRSSEYVDDDDNDSASNSSVEVDKPPVSILNGEPSTAAEAVQRLQAVLGSSLRLENEGGGGEEKEEENGDNVSSTSSFVVPSVDSARDRERDDFFASLPDDCLTTVFRKLSNKDLANCALVCKWWFMVDALSRSSLSLKATEDLRPHLPKLLNRFQAVQKLVLRCDRAAQSINDEALDTIAQNCPRLRKFKLKNCKQVTDAGMESFSRACPELKKFSCGGCGFGVVGLSALLQHCTALEDLTVKRSIRSTLMGAAGIPGDGGGHGGGGGDGANTLTLSLAGGGRIVVGIPVMFDSSSAAHGSIPVGAGAAAAAAAAHGRGGLHPGLGGGPAGAPAAGNGAHGAPGAPGGGRPDGPGPSHPPPPPPQLEVPGELNLRRLCLKDQSGSTLWVPLLEAAMKVETLILARNGGAWDPVLAASLGAGKMPELTQLYLEKLHITDRALRCVAKCPKLEALVVVRTSECTDEGISAIAAGCPTLKRLHIEGWSPGHIGDRGLTSLATHCRLLQELVLVGHSCTSASMQPLATNCPGLERLTLCSSLSMSDAEMRIIASSCPNLRRLCVKACMRVTDAGIKILATGCPSLQKLKIRRCSNVTQGGLDFLQDQRPELSITQESSSAATAAAEARNRNRAAGEGGEPLGALAGRVFDERDDAEFQAQRQRRDHRDESPELLRLRSLGAAGGEHLMMRHGGRPGGARARFAQAATTIQRALRNWIGAPGGGPVPGLPPNLRSLSPFRERENRESGRD